MIRSGIEKARRKPRFLFLALALSLPAPVFAACDFPTVRKEIDNAATQGAFITFQRQITGFRAQAYHQNTAIGVVSSGQFEGADDTDQCWRIASAALEQLYLPGPGRFVYQRQRLLVNRVPYLRWTQAWVFRALCTLLRRG